ncbi:glycosyltransferase [Aequorivita sublithincola DSM 14238]|uniref:Glycosyltransferase n=1 Tax=Aequorivita sublithincola (strain DSM 14238 / LMG 21431 / ACAM 643 / 9-3) TaxID=746697 RepID=I3YZD8_AEQSU|nr:glycosyl transferase [Aequorivita sublithincola]AFL82356.1 glycosyltransferase [Aequorivita sublithincola DSM 14238]
MKLSINGENKKVIYLSYTGMLEPLGASQVLNYLKGLASEYSFWLLSLEKLEDLENVDAVEALKRELKDKNISWYPLPYLAGGKNYLKNFQQLYSLTQKYIDEEQISYLHCRSYMPATIAWLLKKRGKKINYLFDTRGFWFDEKADVGEWKKSGLSYKLAKVIEKTLYNNAIAIVMLSQKSVDLINDGSLFKGSEKLKNVYFIPTCTDLERFSPAFNKVNKPIKIGYIGTAIGWYNFEKTAELLQLIKKEVHYELEIYNGGQHQFIKETLLKYGFEDNEYSLKKVGFNEIPEKMRQLDLSVFFIHPFFSKNASAATKFGELMASGVPILTNKNVGDHQYFVEHYGTGKILDINKLNTYNYTKIIMDLKSSIVVSNCRKLADDVFSLYKGVGSYSKLYKEFFE